VKTWKVVTSLLTLFYSQIALSSLVTYDSLASLESITGPVVIEDWKSYEQYTVLSNQTLNGIEYPGDNTLNESLVTLGEFCTFGCMSYLTPGGSTRSFGSRPLTFGFTSQISVFSLSITQGINASLDGTSIWNISFNTGASAMLKIDYTLFDSSKSGYIGFSGIKGATSITIDQVRNDANVVWRFNHIGFQSTVINTPSVLMLFILGLLVVFTRKTKH
jgi:hypothetical protein